MSGWTPNNLAALDPTRFDAPSLIDAAKYVHAFEPVGGNFPNTCRLCACLRESANHVQSQPVKARGRVREPKGMNKAERQYSAHLDLEKRIGAIRWWRFEGMTLKLADDCRLTPDFVVMLADGTLELHDTKVVHRGKTRPHIEDDALVKLRTAAEMYEITIKAVWPAANGEWEARTF